MVGHFILACRNWILCYDENQRRSVIANNRWPPRAAWTKRPLVLRKRRLGKCMRKFFCIKQRRRRTFAVRTLCSRRMRAEAMIPASMVTETAVVFFHTNLYRSCPGVDGDTPCPEQCLVSVFRYECGATDSEDGLLQVHSVRIVCACCIYDVRWDCWHSVKDTRLRRRTCLYAHDAYVQGPCAL